MAWDDNLAGPALAIASARETPLLALAGPGTGKTFSLIRRVARLLEEDCPPERIFMVTFARTAAQDLLRSLRDLEAEGARRVSARTLHSYCFSVLGSEGVLRVTDRVPRILAEFESKLLLADLEPDAAFGTLTARLALTRAFEAAWARRQADNPGDPVANLDQAFQGALLGSLRWYRAMLVGELVPIALRFLRENPAAEELRAFDHVVIDEYQDLNRAEQDLIELLARNGSLTVIGDDDQSIYSFKWANPEGIRTFEAEHPGTRRIPLEECRRCPTRVVEMAASLIGRDPHRLPHNLTPRAMNRPGDIHNVQWDSIGQEAAGIAAFVGYHIAQGVPAGQCLVLAPNRIVGYGIRDAMRDAGIDTRSFFKEEPIDNVDAQEAFTLLNLLANPDDRTSMRAWLGLRSSTMRRGPYRRAFAIAQAEGMSVREILGLCTTGRLRLLNPGDLLERFLALNERLDALRALALPDLIDVLLPAGVEPVEDLRQIALGALGDASELGDLVALVRSSISQPEVPIESTDARVMSFYKSKGLTASLVVLAGLVEGLIPGTPKERWTPEQREAFLEEQRRLFYVGLTRTTRTLVLSSYSTLPAATARHVGAQIGRYLPRGQTVTVLASSLLGELGHARPDAVRGVDWTYS